MCVCVHVHTCVCECVCVCVCVRAHAHLVTMSQLTDGICGDHLYQVSHDSCNPCAQCKYMVGTFQATAEFQDPDVFKKKMFLKSNNNGVKMHFVCDFAPLRIQTLIVSYPCK